MTTLALNIKMQGKIAVIIGGGAVALRKIRALLVAGASVRVVSLTVSTEIALMQNSGLLTIRLGSYTHSDLKGVFLVVAATDDHLLNEQISADADKMGVLVTDAGNPRIGNCTFPAILRRGDLEITVSTGGSCPTFAADVRDTISEHIGEEYAFILKQLVEKREKLLTNGGGSTYNTQVLRSLAKDLLAEFTDSKD